MRINSSPRTASFRKTQLCLAIAALLIPGLSFSAPVIGNGGVTSGSATIGQSGNVTNVNQTSNKATINWQSFGTKPAETVNFNQPNASSLTLNRVIGNEKSVLEGALNANGKVFLVNSNGVLFTKGSSVNTAGFVASTLNLTDDDFNAGHYVFKANGGSGSVINLGTLTAKDGGYVALLGNTVSNQGVISATKGTVAMSSGDRITLNFNGDSLLSITIDEGTLNALVENKQAVYADGGQVIMTAKAADNLLSAQVNNTGLVQAHTIDDLKGHIELNAHGGTTHVDGTLDASAPTSGDGGFIETSGDHVKIADSTLVTTASATGHVGNWLIDPDGFTVGTGGDMSAKLLSGLLQNGDITLASSIGNGNDGNININEAVSWSSDSVLGLIATHDININASITATGAHAGLMMKYGGDYNILTRATYSGTVLDSNGNPVADKAPDGTQFASVTLSGANATLNINNKDYQVIHSMTDLTAVSGTGNYALGNDIDASAASYTDAIIANLNGTLTGLGHTISHLTINDPVAGDNVGLVGIAGQGSLIRDIGLVDVDITGTAAGGGFYGFGALVGQNFADINHAYSTGKVTGGQANVGGLVGLDGTYGEVAVNTISDSFSEAAVYGQGGGLVGRAQSLNIYRSHASGDVTSPYGEAGGLVGYAVDASIYDSYASGNVLGGTAVGGLQYATYLGGLVGEVDGSLAQTVTNSYATGNVTGAYGMGGLIGALSTGADYVIDNSYATGNVAGSQTQSSVFDVPGIGGLVGNTNLSFGSSGTITIKNSHATGNVSFSGTFGNDAGGLVGSMTGKSVVDNSYATGNVAAGTNGNGAGGLIGVGSATDVSNSQASGNVTGNRTVAGLVGGNSGTITNSSATGNVTGSANVGGLVGTNNGTVSNSFATGNVTGIGTQSDSFTGGVVGTNTGTVLNSYATGLITGPAGLTGGVAGANFGGGSVVNSYYNIEINPDLERTGTNQVLNQTDGTVTGGGGLTTAQFADIKFYLDGTIGQVLAARAAQAAADQAAENQAEEEAAAAAQAEADATAATAAATAAGVVLKARVAAAGQSSASLVQASQRIASSDLPKPSFVSTIPSIDSHIVYAGSNDFSADIKSITVDGVRFNLEDDGAAKPKTGNGQGSSK